MNTRKIQYERDLRIPGHPDYVATSNGEIRGPDRRHPDHPIVDMPQFWDEDEQRMMVILFVYRPFTSAPDHPARFVPLAFPAAQMIAHAWGAPDGYGPGFKDRDSMNLSLDNLVMPTGWQRYADDDTPFKCPFCQWRGRSRSWLSRHIQEKHSDRNYKV